MLKLTQQELIERWSDEMIVKLILRIDPKAGWVLDADEETGEPILGSEMGAVSFTANDVVAQLQDALTKGTQHDADVAWLATLLRCQQLA